MGKIMVLHPMCDGADFARELIANYEDVDVVSLDQGPTITRSAMDYALAGPDSVKKAREAEKAGYEAIILSCHGEPNLHPLRESVRIPVLGCTQVAMHLCSLLARRATILIPREIFAKRSKEDVINRNGLQSRLASVRQVSFDVPLEDVGELSRRRPVPEELIGPVVNEAIKAIEEDDATAITFGCLFMGMIASEIQQRLKDEGYDVLVVNPLPMAVEVARLLVKNKLSHSALAFPLAEHYEVKGLEVEKEAVHKV